MRRIIVVIAGILLAFLFGLILLSAGLAVEAFAAPVTDTMSMVRTLALMLAAVGPAAAPRWLAAGLHAAWVAALALCFAPVTVIALLGEAAGVRSLSWSAGATGLATAAIPSIARAALSRSPDLLGHPSDGRLTVLLFLTGIGAGSVYWTVAGRPSR